MVEQTAPHDVAVYRVPDSVLDVGEQRAIDIACQYRDCQETGFFAGVAGGELLELCLPSWTDGLDQIPNQDGWSLEEQNETEVE